MLMSPIDLKLCKIFYDGSCWFWDIQGAMMSHTTHFTCFQCVLMIEYEQ